MTSARRLVMDCISLRLYILFWKQPKILSCFFLVGSLFFPSLSLGFLFLSSFYSSYLCSISHLVLLVFKQRIIAFSSLLMKNIGQFFFVPGRFMYWILYIFITMVVRAEFLTVTDSISNYIQNSNRTSEVQLSCTSTPFNQILEFFQRKKKENKGCKK